MVALSIVADHRAGCRCGDNVARGAASAPVGKFLIFPKFYETKNRPYRAVQAVLVLQALLVKQSRRTAKTSRTMHEIPVLQVTPAVQAAQALPALPAPLPRRSQVTRQAHTSAVSGSEHGKQKAGGHKTSRTGPSYPSSPQNAAGQRPTAPKRHTRSTATPHSRQDPQKCRHTLTCPHQQRQRRG